VQGSAILAASVDEYSHAYFAKGETGGLSLFSFSTHPPLKQRILRIDPSWNGRYTLDKKSVVAEKTENHSEQLKARVATAIMTSGGLDFALNDALNALNNIGDVSKEQVEAAQLWRKQLPDVVLAQAENPYGAQALILAMLLDKNADIEQKQYVVLNKVIGEIHTENVRQVRQDMSELADGQTLPLIDLALPTLREMTVEQYQRFKQCLVQLVNADNKIDLREWIIQRVVLQHLDEQYGHRKKPVAKYFVLGSAKYASELMLSLLAYLEHKQQVLAQQAFDGAKRSVGIGALKLLPKNAISLDSLNDAMDELEFLKPHSKNVFYRLVLAASLMMAKSPCRRMS